MSVSRDPAVVNPSSSAGTAFPAMRGVRLVTDIEVIQDFYRSKGIRVESLGTLDALKTSKDSYPVPWLSRETGQNMSDHNPHDRGTVNGVEFRKEINADGSATISIVGHWNFKDITGAIMSHSDKEHSGDAESAGGNGVGLKQAAIRFVRDLGVDFEIHGGDSSGGWIVSYQKILAEDFNRELRISGSESAEIKHDYFVAVLKEAPPTSSCKYVFKTSNTEVIDSLMKIHEIMVCDHNPYLQKLDFKNEAGAVKWILPETEQTEPAQGRLFMNGQVYGFKEKGPDNNYWLGLP